SAGGPTNGTRPANSSEWFPCFDSWYPGRSALIPMGYSQNPGAFYSGVDPYAWAVCHSGWWIPQDNHYVWVAGARRHHKCPVKWVKFKHQTVAVPLHPKDVKNKAPLN